MPTSAFLSKIRSRAMPLIVATALMMENIDSTVISTSLPAIAKDLGTNPIHLKLALTSYLLALAIFIPASGWMADRIGARKVFRAAIALFAVGSIACGMSTNLATLVAARVLQGMGGSMMVPVGRLIVLRTTEKAGLVNALAWLTVPALLGPVLGPPLGGFITTYFHWRWIFWVNIPIAVFGIVLVTLYIPKIGVQEARRPFDLSGFVLAGPGLAAFLTGITLSGLSLATPAYIAVLTVGGLVLIAGYARHAYRVEEPLVDLRLLRFDTFRISALGGTFFRVGGGAMPFLLPLLFQLGFGLTPFQSGLMTFATGFGAIFMKFMAQRILTRWGFRRVLMVNAAVAAALLFAPAFFTAQTPYLVMIGTLFAGGLSRSLQFTSITAMAYAEVPAERLSSATSFNSVLQQLSGSIGITIAAFGLEMAQALIGGDSLSAAHFPMVFALVALVSLSSDFWFARLARDAGGVLLEKPGRG